MNRADADNSGKRRLSSRQTIFYKGVALSIFVICVVVMSAGLGDLFILQDENYTLGDVPVLLFVGTLGIFALRELRHVQAVMEDGVLTATRFGKITLVTPEQVVATHCVRGFAGHLVELRLEQRSAFGRTISFIPKFHPNIFARHPICDKIQLWAGGSTGDR